jgi:hypothetical protein
VIQILFPEKASELPPSFETSLCVMKLVPNSSNTDFGSCAQELDKAIPDRRNGDGCKTAPSLTSSFASAIAVTLPSSDRRDGATWTLRYCYLS